MSKKKLIALSDGHGVDTAGKRTPTLPNGQKSETGKVYMNENLFNRAVVKYLKEYLIYNGFDVLEVAPTDADTPLATRTSLANSRKSDLYVSVHANAASGKWGNHGGIETFVYPSGESQRIGSIIHKHLLKGTKLRDRGVKDGKKAQLHEILRTNMPAVLVEAGFMDSHTDYKYLLSDAYRRETAREIAMGICEAYKVTFKEKGTNTSTVIKKATEGLQKVSTSTKVNTQGTIKVLVDNLNYYNSPRWDKPTGTVKKNTVLTIVEKIKVGTAYQYKTVSGTYITASDKYVKFTKK